MGTYPELPSYVLETGEDLQDVLDRNVPQLVGDSVHSKWGSKLPYLPKVLSIQKALPLQIHPNRKLSEKLHDKYPDKFTDPNHKPEIALALGPFEAFCGFKPLSTISELMKLPPFKRFLSNGEMSSINDESLRRIVNLMLKAPESTIANVMQMLEGMREDDFAPESRYIPKMAKRLRAQYDKTDPGSVVALITMNYIQLNGGDSIYIPADGIHAYLSGDIIECMARSNNVLNTGFCPAPDRDSVDLFTSALTFKQHDPQEPILQAHNFKRAMNGRVKLYAPPMCEFNMLVVVIGKGQDEVIEELGGPAIAIVTTGSGIMETTNKHAANGREQAKNFRLQDGFIFFIGYGNRIKLESQTGLQMAIAFAE